jgi:coenzyme F420-reducing hydrogenase alpha subunit
MLWQTAQQSATTESAIVGGMEGTINAEQTTRLKQHADEKLAAALRSTSFETLLQEQMVAVEE